MRGTSRVTGVVIAILALLGLAAPASMAGRTAASADKANANGEIQMLAPNQKIHFNIAQGHVEYWNYDYPEGHGSLTYHSSITCSSINKATSEARFMFQIPDGHPGLSGLYVVAYVKIVDANAKSYLYGHAATSDLPTATAWCETGAGFAPTMYEVKSGVLYVK